MKNVLLQLLVQEKFYKVEKQSNKIQSEEKKT